ncbi:MAG: tryptophan 7-halogenase [Verrucomicrobia bacterium]|nr:tryptophan 7-halogenase [Verrucomicrobiota bacterium]
MHSGWRPGGEEEPVLRQTAPEARRLTPVMRYTNYQLISTRLHGRNWAMTGDSAGFVDPVFSSGLFLAMDSSVALAKAILSGTESALEHYAAYTARHLTAWQELIAHYYNGKLFTSFVVGEAFRKTLPGALLFRHVSRHMGQIFMGSAALKPYSRGLLEFLVKYGLRGHDPKLLQIN